MGRSTHIGLSLWSVFSMIDQPPTPDETPRANRPWPSAVVMELDCPLLLTSSAHGHAAALGIARPERRVHCF